MTALRALPAEPHPWLDRLTADADQAVDALLRGVADLAWLQRATPSQALMAIMADAPDAAPEWALLDQALCGWLQRRHADDGALLRRPGGTNRFIRETSEGLRAAWRLGRLPISAAWIHDHADALLRWAEGFPVSRAYDLGEAVLIAVAHAPPKPGRRFLWNGVCIAAAARRLRHRLDIAFLGLARLVDSSADPARPVIAGFAQWAAHLPAADQRSPKDAVDAWLGLKGSFPHQPSFWRQRWEELKANDHYADRPFVDWLLEGDKATLTAPPKGAPKRAPLIPPNIPKLLTDFKQVVARDGLRAEALSPMRQLLDQLERYAELTGESYYLVTSSDQVAKIIMPTAPGLSLSLVRRALLWAPSNPHSWSLRATALERLGKPDLAEAALWEALRRIPSEQSFHDQLAKLLIRQEKRAAAAQYLLRRRVALSDPVQDRVSAQVALYNLAQYEIAFGDPADARRLTEDYAVAYGEDHRTATLRRLLAAGAQGRDEAQAHLRQAPTVSAAPEWETATRARALAGEEQDADRLARIARVGRADLDARLGEKNAARQALDAALRDDPDDAYAHLARMLAFPDDAPLAGRLQGHLPLLLAQPQPDWRALMESFAEEAPLIDWARWTQDGVLDGEGERRLRDWIDSPSRWDGDWDRHFKAQTKLRLVGAETALSPQDTLHDALAQKLDTGWAVRSAA